MTFYLEIPVTLLIIIRFGNINKSKSLVPLTFFAKFTDCQLINGDVDNNAVNPDIPVLEQWHGVKYSH